MFVLDTDILVDLQRGHAAARAWLAGLAGVPSVPGLVVMELIQGARDAWQVRDALRLTAPFSIVWPTIADHQRALAAFKTFHLSQGSGLLDALIGACAVGLSAELCTFNHKHFRVVPGLVTVQPYTH